MAPTTTGTIALTSDAGGSTRGARRGPSGPNSAWMSATGAGCGCGPRRPYPVG